MNIFPSIKDGVFNFIRKFIAWALAILVIIFSFYIINFFAKENRELSLNQAIISEYTKQLENNKKYHLNSDGIFLMFENLKKQNDDFYGWISNGDLCINSPVMLTEEKDFYRSHNFNKTPSSYGMIYVDSNCKIVGNKNIILYGKNNTNGFAFSNLDKYLDLSYYKSNPVIKFDTLNTKNEYVIFAVAKLNDTHFDYTKTNFTDAEVYEYLEKIKKHSIYSNNINANHKNNFLTLVCDMGTDESLVLFAKNLTNEEELLNLNILMTTQK